jgi:virulence factor
MIKNLIEKYKNKKKQSFLDLPKSYKQKYAFIGVGGHSIANLYPVLSYLGVPIIKVFSGRISNADKMASRFAQAEGVDNIESILNDSEVTGVFICLKPDMHFNIVKQCLEAGKNVFVEKPPCLDISELDLLAKIEKERNKICITGMQRRYSPVYKTLKIKTKSAISYNYHFYSGSYPEGNALYDLFIHPVDTLIYLFGEIKNIKANVIKNSKGLSISLLTEHNSGCKGVAELSCLYTWRKLEEGLKVLCPKAYYDAKYPLFLSETKLQSQILGIPLEKALPAKHSTTNIYYDNNGINPVLEQNSLVLQGYTDELQTFINLCEKNTGNNQSSCTDMIPVFECLKQINQIINQV